MRPTSAAIDGDTPLKRFGRFWCGTICLVAIKHRHNDGVSYREV